MKVTWRAQIDDAHGFISPLRNLSLGNSPVNREQQGGWLFAPEGVVISFFKVAYCRQSSDKCPG